MARRRRRNTNGNHPGLGAFIGSLLGGVPGHIVYALGSPGVGGALTTAGWIVGGGIGGAIGAKPDRDQRSAVGGAVGGLFTPLGAALGGYIAGRKPDRKSNPERPWILPAAVGGALVVGTGLGVAAGKQLQKKKGRTNRLTPSVPGSYDQILCNPYKGHQICVYRFDAYAVDGNRYDGYDVNIDGGALIADREYPYISAEGAISAAQGQIDAFGE